MNGRVDDRELHVDYKFNSRKNPQVYAVHGKVRDAKDWRVLRLKMTAHSPWLSGIELVFMAGLLGFWVVTGEKPPSAAIATFLIVTGIYALANLILIPAQVKERVASMMATQVSGSVQAGDRWVVPS
jgi:hypothetical protein